MLYQTLIVTLLQVQGGILQNFLATCKIKTNHTSTVYTFLSLIALCCEVSLSFRHTHIYDKSHGAHPDYPRVISKSPYNVKRWRWLGYQRADKIGFLDCLGQRGAAHWEDDLFDMEIKWDGGAPISHPGLGVDWGLFNHSYQPGPLLFNWPRREAWGGREEREACRTLQVNRELMEPIIQRRESQLWWRVGATPITLPRESFHEGVWRVRHSLES